MILRRRLAVFSFKNWGRFIILDLKMTMPNNTVDIYRVRVVWYLRTLNYVRLFLRWTLSDFSSSAMTTRLQ